MKAAPTNKKTPDHFGSALLGWYDRESRALPWRVYWKKTADPYYVWISEIMLQQTVMKVVIPAYEAFLKAFPTLTDLAAADETQVRHATRGLGYYRRFRMMHAAAKILQETYAPLWPQTYAAWLELPGIGPYTAAAISSICFDAPHPVVDGNVERVLCRQHDLRVASNDPIVKKRYPALVAEVFRPDRPGDFNQALMELGQRVCTKEKPACPICPVAGSCLARARGSQDLAPLPKQRAEATELDIGMIIDLHRPEAGEPQIFLRERLGGKFLNHTKGFDLSIGSSPELGSIVGRFRHSITHHKIRAAVSLRGHKTLKTLAEQGSWHPVSEISELLTTNLDRKAWKVAEAFFAPTPTKPAQPLETIEAQAF